MPYKQYFHNKPNKIMTWSEEAWMAAEPIYNAIINHPFIKEIAAGTLPMERFTYYLEQDEIYLDDYSKIMANIASRFTNLNDLATFLTFANEGVAMERKLHASFMPRRYAKISPAALFYTSFLKSLAMEDIAVGVAGVLPCFMVYQKVGNYIHHNADWRNNPYIEWIKTYADPTFDNDTRRCAEIANRLAEKVSPEVRKRMTQAFVRCSQLEWLNWDAAYKFQQWPDEINFNE